MMIRRVILLIAVVALAGCGGNGQTGGDGNSFVSGDGTITVLAKSDRPLAPTLSGPTLADGQFDGSAIVGRVAVINLWASWCAPCRAEAPTLARLARDYDDVAFVGLLTRDNITAANAFVQRFDLPYPTIVDEAQILKFSGVLAPNAIPTTLVVDRQGRIAARLSGEVTYAGLSGVLEEIIEEER